MSEVRLVKDPGAWLRRVLYAAEPSEKGFYSEASGSLGSSGPEADLEGDCMVGKRAYWRL